MAQATLILAATHRNPSVVGVMLIVFGVLHFVFRRFYARREAAVQTARRETALAPMRRMWLWPTDEQTNLVWTTAISVVMVAVGVLMVLLNL